MEKLALIIGNAKYAFEQIPNAVSDARLMEETLTPRGFTVTRLENQDANEIEAAVTVFAQKAVEQCALALFYFAGHAIELNGAAYLLGTGMSQDLRPDSVLREAFALSEFFQLTTDVKTPRIVVLDACRTTTSDWSDDQWRMFAERISHERQKGENRHDNVLIGYSTSSGDPAADGQGENSLYTLELCRQILLHGITIEDCFKDIGLSIVQQSEQRQRPWFYSSLNAQVTFSDLPAFRKFHSFHVPIKPDEGGLFLTPWDELMAFSDVGYLLRLNASGFGSKKLRSRIDSCAVTAKGEFIAVNTEGQVTIGDQVFNCPKARLTGVVASPSGDSFIVFCGNNIQVFRRSAQSWTVVASHRGKAGRPWMSALFVTDDVALVGGQSSQLVRIENITGKPRVKSLESGYLRDVYSLTALSAEDVLCTLSGGELWIVSSSSESPRHWASLGRFVKTASSRRGSLINSVNDDEMVYRLVFEPETYTEEDIDLLKSNLETNHLLFSALSPHHPVLAVGSAEGLIYLIDIRNAVTVQIIDHGVGRDHSLDGLAFSENGNLVVLGQNTISYYVPLFEPGKTDQLLPDL